MVLNLEWDRIEILLFLQQDCSTVMLPEIPEVGFDFLA